MTERGIEARAAQSRHVHRLVDALAQLGLRAAVVSPGYRDAPLALAVAAHPDITLQVCIDERTAGFVALGAARACQRPVALICSSGSAPAHYHPALIEAYHQRVPLLVLSADRPDELHHVGAAQTTPQRHLFLEHTVWRDTLPVTLAVDAEIPADADPLAMRVAQAWAAATGPAGGPVHLNLPLRKPLELGPAAPRRAVPRIHTSPPAFTPEQRARLREIFGTAARVLVVAGPMHDAPAAAAADAVQMCHRLGWPVAADPLSPIRGQPGVIQTADAIAGVEALRERFRPDVVLWWGELPSSRPLLELLQTVRGSLVQLSPDGRVYDPAFRVSDVVVAEPGSVFSWLADTAAPAPQAWRELWTRADSALRARAVDAAQPWWDGAAWRAALQAWPGSRVHVGNSLPVRDLDAAVSVQPHQRVWGNRGVNGIDGGVATAWGAMWGSSEPVLALLGDVALAHDLGAVGQLPHWARVVLVVVDNGGGQIFGELPLREVADFEQLFLTPPERELSAAAAVAGLPYARAHDAAELTQALERFWAEGGRGFLDVKVDPEQARAVRRARRRLIAETLHQELGA